MGAPLLFALTMFVSATLLFLVQPMIGKMVTPLLGGTPAVWNTCMVFYQGLLLAGYYYAHRTTALAAKKQTTIHLLVMFAALGFLLLAGVISINGSPMPIVKDLSPQGDDYPFFGVILLLSVAIGLPFFVVSTSAPLMQKWFAETGHPSSKDPYFLYAASNFGSLLALIAYPAVVEPNLRIIHQNWIWAGGYGLLVVLALACARAVRVGPPPARPETTSSGKSRPGANDGSRGRSSRPGKSGGKSQPGVAVLEKTRQAPAPAATMQATLVVDEHAAPTILQKMRWLALAFVPSSLMLGLTTFVSTDMASIPLLWIIPLSLYLLTFIIVFSNVPKALHLVMTLLMPVLVLLLVFVMTSKIGKFSMQVLLHMATFFVVTMVCHGELAHTRPAAKHLTSFYLIMSLGGMLGGLFNALFAPIVFTFTSEYPITIVLACCLLPAMLLESPKPLGRWTIAFDLIMPVAVFFGCRMLQTNARAFSEYVFNNGAVILMGLMGFVTVALPAILIFDSSPRFRGVLAIFLGGSLALYAIVGPTVESLFASEELGSTVVVYAQAARWSAVVLAGAAYSLYWLYFGDKENRIRYILIGLISCLTCFFLMVFTIWLTRTEQIKNIVLHANIGDDAVRQILVFGLPAMLCYFFVERPVRFGMAVAALWLATFWTGYRAEHEPGIDERYRTYYDRSFFGRLKIETYGNWKKIPVDQFPESILTDQVREWVAASGPTYEAKEFPDPSPNDREGYRIILERKTETYERLSWRQRSTGYEVYYMETEQEKDKSPVQSFYIHRNWSQLVHGTTVHGLQELDKERTDTAVALLALANPDPLVTSLNICSGAGEAMQYPGREPLTYYHRDGPVGSMFRAFGQRNRGQSNANTDVACIGLGTGSLSAYGVPGQTMTFFEIDTHVRRLVQQPRYFTYIDSAIRQKVNIEFQMGDARITMERLGDRKFGFMLIDAFSSDAIPAHLLTKESMELYFRRLEDDGLLAVHISNRYIDLEPVVERLCRELNLEARVMHGDGQEKPSGMERADHSTIEHHLSRYWYNGKYAATWIAIAKTKEALGPIGVDTDNWLAEDPEKRSRSNRWIPLTPNNKVGLWTDDYSPIIPVLRGEWKFWARDDR